MWRSTAATGLALVIALVPACGVQHSGPGPAPHAAAASPGTNAGTSQPSQPPQPLALPAARPTALTIPRIGVHAPLGSVGLTADGALEVPRPGPHYDEPAWYRYSPSPGSTGPAVVLGHVDSAAHGPSVFYRLRLLRPGDRVEVARADGRTAVFRVAAVRTFPKADFPTDLVYADTPGPELRLITCGGAFDRTWHSYVDNVVVLATFVASHASA